VDFVRFFKGGNATRAEVYGLFIATVILVGGGVGGAIAVTSNSGNLERVRGGSQVSNPILDEAASQDDSEGYSGQPSRDNPRTAEPPKGNSEGDDRPRDKPRDGGEGPTNPGETEQQPSREDRFYGAPVAPLPPPRTVPAPNVIGWTYDQVKDWTLANLRRYPAWVTTDCFGSDFPPGTVARQSPRPGEPIIDDYDPVTTSASSQGVAIWMERDTYVGPNWYSEGPCVY
jgi:hypothetical protein